MPEPARRYTVRDLESFPDDGKKYELIRGELIVSPAPSVIHQLVVQRLAGELRDYLKPLGLVNTLFQVAADISWDDDTLLQPDILVVRPEELTRRWSSIKHLRLAAEVLSTSSGRRDRFDKRRLYQERRVETYWVVDPDAELVEEWHPGDEGPLTLAETLRWQVTSDAPVLAIEIPTLFRELPPEDPPAGLRRT
jgi:Uma2 family endonuclease